MDPLAEKYPTWSPYNYSYNNPIIFSDPDGRGPGSTIPIPGIPLLPPIPAPGSAAYNAPGQLLLMAFQEMREWSRPLRENLGIQPKTEIAESENSLNEGAMERSKNKTNSTDKAKEDKKKFTQKNPAAQAKKRDEYDKSLKQQPTPTLDNGTSGQSGPSMKQMGGGAGGGAAAIIETAGQMQSAHEVQNNVQAAQEAREAAMQGQPTGQDNTKIVKDDKVVQ